MAVDRIAGGLAGQAQPHERMGLQDERSALPLARPVLSQPRELWTEEVRMHTVATNRLGAPWTEGSVDGPGVCHRAYVEPQDGGTEGSFGVIDENGRRRLSGDGDGLHARERHAVADAAANEARRAPPTFGARFRPTGPSSLVQTGFVGLRDHSPVRVKGRTPDARRSDVDTEHRCGASRHGPAPRPRPIVAQPRTRAMTAITSSSLRMCVVALAACRMADTRSSLGSRPRWRSQ